MNELQASPAVYRIEKSIEPVRFSAYNPLDRIQKNTEVIRVCSEHPIVVVDAVYDSIRNRRIIAVFTQASILRCETDYLILTPDFQLIKVLREDQGSGPSFLTAPDGSVWVKFASNNIVLPLEGRSRIAAANTAEPYFIRNVRFSLYGQPCVYRAETFPGRKDDELLISQFSGELYTSQKQITLDGVWNGHPTVYGDTCYVTYGKWDDDNRCTAHIAVLDEAGTMRQIWQSEPLKCMCDVFLLAAPNDQVHLLTYCDDHADELICDANGTVQSRSIVYQEKQNINLLYEMQVRDDTFAVMSGSVVDIHTEKTVLLFAQSGVVRVYDTKNPDCTASLLDGEYLLVNNRSLDAGRCEAKIVRI